LFGYVCSAFTWFTSLIADENLTVKNGLTFYYKNRLTFYYKNGLTFYYKNGLTFYYKNGLTFYYKMYLSVILRFEFGRSDFITSTHFDVTPTPAVFSAPNKANTTNYCDVLKIALLNVTLS